MKYYVRFYLRTPGEYWEVCFNFSHNKSIVEGDFIQVASGEKLSIKEVCIVPADGDPKAVFLLGDTIRLPHAALEQHKDAMIKAGMLVEKIS